MKKTKGKPPFKAKPNSVPSKAGKPQLGAKPKAPKESDGKGFGTMVSQKLREEDLDGVYREKNKKSKQQPTTYEDSEYDTCEDPTTRGFRAGPDAFFNQVEYVEVGLVSIMVPDLVGDLANSTRPLHLHKFVATPAAIAVATRQTLRDLQKRNGSAKKTKYHVCPFYTTCECKKKGAYRHPENQALRSDSAFNRDWLMFDATNDLTKVYDDFPNASADYDDSADDEEDMEQTIPEFEVAGELSDITMGVLQAQMEEITSEADLRSAKSDRSKAEARKRKKFLNKAAEAYFKSLPDVVKTESIIPVAVAGPAPEIVGVAAPGGDEPPVIAPAFPDDVEPDESVVLSASFGPGGPSALSEREKWEALASLLRQEIKCCSDITSVNIMQKYLLMCKSRLTTARLVPNRANIEFYEETVRTIVVAREEVLPTTSMVLSTARNGNNKTKQWMGEFIGKNIRWVVPGKVLNFHSADKGAMTLAYEVQPYIMDSCTGFAYPGSERMYIIPEGSSAYDAKYPNVVNPTITKGTFKMLCDEGLYSQICPCKFHFNAFSFGYNNIWRNCVHNATKAMLKRQMLEPRSTPYNRANAYVRGLRLVQLLSNVAPNSTKTRAEMREAWWTGKKNEKLYRDTWAAFENTANGMYYEETKVLGRNGLPLLCLTAEPFVKVEAATAIDDEKSDPRLITNDRVEHLVHHGPFFYDYQKRFMSVNGVTFEENGSLKKLDSPLLYTGGLTPQELGTVFKEMIRRQMYIIEIDLSRCDGRFEYEGHSAVLNFQKRMGLDPEAYDWLVRGLHTSYVLRGKFSAEVRGTTGSGRINTSLSTSDGVKAGVILAVHRYLKATRPAYKQLAHIEQAFQLIEFVLSMHLGDDSVVGTVEYVPAKWFEDAFTEMGHKAEVLYRGTAYHTVTYCSGRFWEVSSDTYLWCPNIFRTMNKIGVCTSSAFSVENVNVWLYRIMEGMKHYEFLPVFGSVIRRILKNPPKNLTKKLLNIKDPKDYNPFKIVLRYPIEVDPAYIDRQFTLIYGMDAKVFAHYEHVHWEETGRIYVREDCFKVGMAVDEILAKTKAIVKSDYCTVTTDTGQWPRASRIANHANSSVGATISAIGNAFSEFLVGSTDNFITDTTGLVNLSRR